jgi:CRISPR-associated protein (TIGR03986 family)
MITSPYNFVPVVDQVFAPDWGEPSHDMPFKDGLSGELQITMTAQTPIFIRGSSQKPSNLTQLLSGREPMRDADFRRWTDFHRSPNEHHYEIPATAWKGMLRNVIKIACFGSIEDADDVFISVRDLNDQAYRDEITQQRPDGSREPLTIGGWLSVNPDTKEWEIEQCEIARVEQSVIEAHLRLSGREFNQRQPAEKKYQKWASNTDIDFDFDPAAPHRHSSERLFYSKVRAATFGKGKTKGQMVFTGQPSEDKHMEFIFHSRTGKRFGVARQAMRKFKDTHPDDLSAWRYWQQKLKSGGEVPIFWLPGTTPDEPILAFGLSQMFRLPAKSVHQAIPRSHFHRTSLDLSERLFGTLGDDPLRGRLHPSPLLSVLPCSKFDEDRWLTVAVLGKPQPSFYPAYLEQPNYPANHRVSHHNTWLTPDARIRGWKRYHVAADDKPGIVEPRHEHPVPEVKGKPSYGSATALRPLPSGTAFTGALQFHNLTRREFGSLIWALTWGANKQLRHSLGMGKSMGLGNCVFSIDRLSLSWKGKSDSRHAKEVAVPETFAADCVKDFVDAMDAFTTNELPPALRADWLNSEPMKQLLAMANPGNARRFDKHVGYPTLPAFRHLKSYGCVLPRPTEIIDNQIVPSDRRQVEL